MRRLRRDVGEHRELGDVTTLRDPAAMEHIDEKMTEHDEESEAAFDCIDRRSDYGEARPGVSIHLTRGIAVRCPGGTETGLQAECSAISQCWNPSYIVGKNSLIQ
jgi:hypothetical protein